MSDRSPALADLRAAIRAAGRAGESAALAGLTKLADLDGVARQRISARGADLVRQVREGSQPGLMELFLAEYGLSTREGVALMCLAEALLRTPDAQTIDALIEDKIAPSDWSAHLGQAASPLINASTWALMLTGQVLQDDDEWIVGTLRGALKRLGEPVIRVAATRAMKELGRQFVLGRDIDEALDHAGAEGRRGYLHSYDMLGEAALTASDAERYAHAYAAAIDAIARRAHGDDVRDNPGISVKMSALHPRYQEAQRERAMTELAPLLLDLARRACAAGIGFSVDAEESERLEISLDIIEAVLGDPALAGWDGFGVVVQAYGPRAAPMLDWLHALARRLHRRLMVRLVKGAYWDTEIKRAQVMGLDRFPVFTRKPSSDVSYIACARKLLAMGDRLWPQFATHNAHTAAAVLEMAGGSEGFEFQRLHGMGAALHDVLREEAGTRCRIYAPVGPHRDLLAYLVRRLLENGANSSFVHQIVDKNLAPEVIAADPFLATDGYRDKPGHPAIRHGSELFGPTRHNSRGFDLADADDLATIEAARAPFREHRWAARPMIDGAATGAAIREARNPADPDDVVGTVQDAAPADVEVAIGAAVAAQPLWEANGPAARGAMLRRAADLLEANFGELFALAAREAGKTLPDAVAEVREAVDFLRYYAAEAERLGDAGAARGVFVCISPWNFPLAIFTGQIAAALAAGNAVIAKPAEQTPLMAARACQLLREAGIPPGVIQLLPGDGPAVGGRLVADPRIGGVCFTGSTATAQAINRAMAETAPPHAPLIAETGGLNAMIVDSTALPEQAVGDIIASAFQSAGQRCSALRILCLQSDIAEPVSRMLFGAMDELKPGDPWNLATDIGPVIDAEAGTAIADHIARAEVDGRLLKRLAAPDHGTFIGPSVIAIDSIGDLGEEVFGLVLHLARFQAGEIDAVIDAINGSGYGLTFGLHTRIDDRVVRIVDRVHVGNIYVNRNQIGAVVGCQPFGGEGLSGTGPKAGGSNYLPRFRARQPPVSAEPAAGRIVSAEELGSALASAGEPTSKARSVATLPGPTGELNQLSTFARARVLCLGPGRELAGEQARRARAVGSAALAVAPGITDGLDGVVEPEALRDLEAVDVVIFLGNDDTARLIRRALAARSGPIVPLVMDEAFEDWLVIERSICVDTTAAGGNASLLAAGSG